MKTEASAQNTCVIWIDHPNRIVSFQKAEGFEPQSFASPDERISRAVKSRTANKWSFLRDVPLSIYFLFIIPFFCRFSARLLPKGESTEKRVPI